MCWVMPPASPAATLDLRITSSKVVLPWSTWPMIVNTGARGAKSSILSSTSSSTVLSGAWTRPLPRSRFSTSNLKPYLAQIFCATVSSVAWLTLAKTPSSIRSAMILNGFCLSCSASSRTTMGGLMEMTSAPAGSTTLGASTGGSAAFTGTPAFCCGNLGPGTTGPAGAVVPVRTLRMSPRLLKTVLLGSTGRAGSLTLAPLSTALGTCLSGSLMKPTLSPTFGPAGMGGGGGGAGMDAGAGSGSAWAGARPTTTCAGSGTAGVGAEVGGGGSGGGSSTAVAVWTSTL